MAKLALSDTFVSQRNDISVERTRAKIDKALRMLAGMPELGSRQVPLSAKARFGAGIRKLSISPYLIVYRYDRPSDVVFVYCLLYVPAIREAW